jgi:hypothetical protein
VESSLAGAWEGDASATIGALGSISEHLGALLLQRRESFCRWAATGRETPLFVRSYTGSDGLRLTGAITRFQQVVSAWCFILGMRMRQGDAECRNGRRLLSLCGQVHQVRPVVAYADGDTAIFSRSYKADASCTLGRKDAPDRAGMRYASAMLSAAIVCSSSNCDPKAPGNRASCVSCRKSR